MQFLSPEWFDAMADAAAAWTPADDDPIRKVSVTIEQRVHDGPAWVIAFDHGTVSVRASGDADADVDVDVGADAGVDVDADDEAQVRLASDLATATAIASGREAALDAFMVGKLSVGGDVQLLVEHRAALEAVGDVFASVRDRTEFD